MSPTDSNDMLNFCFFRIVLRGGGAPGTRFFALNFEMDPMNQRNGHPPMTSFKRISDFLPALRGLLTREGVPPRLRAIETAPPGAARIALPAHARTPEGIVPALERATGALPKDTEALDFGELGAVQIQRAFAPGRMSGRVALVTGGAQGFGLEIAADLLANGALTAVVDINGDGIRQAAQTLGAGGRSDRVLGLTADVAEPESFSEAVANVVSHFGGVDLLVANAGVLRAGSVKTLAAEDFDFVTRVNYRGFFVCVQCLAPVMALQNRADGALWTDIIQINSKSGLEGSNRNGAYAGSKFGGIGLTQSFALELIEDRIKVNAICPGNFFDGPLWSDPDRGLFVQYLNTGKVPGARTLEDVKRFYENKVPMKRGCTTADVMKAVYYLVEQRYETGQAVPVTGGQVMLK